jgi:hypothetical protein
MERHRQNDAQTKRVDGRLNYRIVVDQSEALKVNLGVTNYKNEKFKEPRITQHRNLKEKVRKFYDDKEGQAAREKASEENLQKQISEGKDILPPKSVG